MYIFSQKKDIVVDTDKITCFTVFQEDIYFENQEQKWILTADSYELGKFNSEKDAKSVLNEIISLAVNGTHQIYDVE